MSLRLLPIFENPLWKDALTGLPNRQAFHHLLEQLMQQAVTQCQSLALLLIDFDNFKWINESHGYGFGDQLLRQVARELERLADSRASVCRLGGDEFALVVTDLSQVDGLLHFAAQLKSDLDSSLVVDGVWLDLKCKVGIACYPGDATTPEAMFNNAFAALQVAQTSDNTPIVQYRPEMLASCAEYRPDYNELKLALKNREFFLVYQPKFDLPSMQLQGLEALLRWRHPLRGVVSPLVFISVAEQTGLIAAIGDWVVKAAIMQMESWQRQEGVYVSVAVNVSPLQLKDDGFVARIKALLNLNGIAGEFLQLELTESSLIEDPRRAHTIIAELRSAGVQIALDDFGTGYSSLAALQTYQLDYLKMDKSFVQKIQTRQGRSVSHAIIQLGHALEMRVIAEGVENAEQEAALCALTCDQVQGFLYSHPLSADQCLAFMKQSGSPDLFAVEEASVASV
ncbi:bifunctional diguanylate cyclase/phosphodiesterase [Undibacterium sp. CY7W]|uniref:Bifunctional diguanylate cyclase/phosphodiesterase n=1 Tax=Undibacterium rugosum TaxID=2762291 RepID=A0A923I340_9BURK|nr:bifunctional diguanylate cyclase/phosphodiesterase [Undibacterium rugosum]MBC3934556.1 bifunctional diguanylate cyclase/phosphodiesterase [Undibacterium rugosum]